MVVNKGRDDARVSIVFNQEHRNSVNFRMPVTPFTEVICGKNNKLALKFSKIKLDVDWGNIFDFKIFIDGIDATTGQRVNKYYNDYPHIRQEKIALMQAS